MDLCLPHSKPCKGGKIMPDGKICSVALGADEGDICEFCRNQSEQELTKNDSNNSSLSNPTAPSSQPITNSDSTGGDNSVKAIPDNSPKPGTNQTLEIKISPQPVDNPKDSLSNQSNEPKKALTINLKDIKKISLVGNNLMIEFNQNSPSQVVVSEQVRDNPVLSKVKNYLQSAQRSTLSQQELASIINQKNVDNSISNSPAPSSPNPLF
jgi:hypothetical protein